jgi:hypothetical protein
MISGKQYEVRIMDSDGYWEVKFSSKSRASTVKKLMTKAMWGCGPLTCESIMEKLSKLKTFPNGSKYGRPMRRLPTQQQVGMVLGRNNLFQRVDFSSRRNISFWEINKEGFDSIERVENDRSRRRNGTAENG